MITFYLEEKLEDAHEDNTLRRRGADRSRIDEAKVEAFPGVHTNQPTT